MHPTLWIPQVNKSPISTHVFTVHRIKIDKFKPAYQHVLDLGRNVPGALLLDVGCCCAYLLCFKTQITQYTVGNDLRKLASDGFPVKNMIASDLRQGCFIL
jgi:hypothetical protein